MNIVLGLLAIPFVSSGNTTRALQPRRFILSLRWVDGSMTMSSFVA